MNHILTAFKEHKEFKKEKYWDANILRFPTDIVTPPHYADTVEIVINHGAIGDIHIGGKHAVAADSRIFFVPPNVVHSMEYKKSDGYVTVMKINHISMKQHLDIETLLSDEGHSIDTLPYFIGDEAVLGNLEETFFKSRSFFDILVSALAFFDRMSAICEPDSARPSPDENNDLRRLIEWTEKNFMNSPTLEDAASILGYNKNYFCQKFKAATGVTYLNYLNCLRIDYACSELKKGRSVTEVCYLCGFENPSYFIKLFRTMVGVTPMKYAASGE